MKDGTTQDTIECTQQEKSRLSKGPSCGFGFRNSKLSIIQIRHQALHKKSQQICGELAGREFSHGILYVGEKNKTVHCSFKKMKTNSYVSSS